MRRYLIVLVLLCMALMLVSPVMASASPEVVTNMYETGKGLVYAMGKYEEGLGVFNAVLELDPTHFDSWIGKAIALEHLQRYDETVEAYEKALELNSTKFNSWYGMGDALLHLNRYEEALEAFDKDLETNPDDWITLYGKSDALYALGRDEEASELSAKADSLR